MSDEKPDLPFIRATYGDADTHFELRWPRLNPDGTVHLIDQDGTNTFTVPVRTASHFYSSFTKGLTLEHSLRSFSTEKNSLILHGLELIVTDARVIVHGLERNNPGQRLVAHLWYPWISDLGFRPKQSFLNESAIDLRYLQDYPLKARGFWWERLELTLHKSFHPGELAREIVRRLAAHHLRHGVPEPARAATSTLLDPEMLPDPVKGSFADYQSPAYVSWPGGVPYLPNVSEVTWEWTITTAAEEQAGQPAVPDTPSGDVAQPQSADLGQAKDEIPANEGTLPAAAGGTVSTPQVSPPPLTFRTRFRVGKAQAEAQVAEAEGDFAEAAELYDRVLELLGPGVAHLRPAQVADMLIRASLCHAAAGHIETALERVLHALQIAEEVHDKRRQIETRSVLWKVLDEQPHHELWAPNLRQLSELTDAVLPRVERADRHADLANAFKRHGHYEDALSEYKLLGDLCHALGDSQREGAALAWQASMLRRADRKGEAHEPWVRSRQLLGDQRSSAEQLPTVFDGFDAPSRKALVLAVEEAAAIGGQVVEPIDWLIGVASAGYLTHSVLGTIGVTAAQIRERRGLTLTHATESEAKQRRVPFGDEMRSAFSRLRSNSEELSNGEVTPVHILLALLPSSEIAAILESFGVEINPLEDSLRAMIAAASVR